MKRTPLAHEWRHSYRSPMNREFRATLHAIYDSIEPWVWRDLIAAGPVLIEGETYQPHPDGEWCFLTPVIIFRPDTIYNADDSEAEVIDIVAWHPATPGRWATRRGAGTVLGDIDLAETLFVHQTPLAWLRSGCRGVCFLDHREIAPALWGFGGKIIAENAAHMRALREACDRARPRIVAA